MPNQPRLIDDPSSDHDTEAAAARRERYLERLREYLQDPDFRAIEGFPIGEDEDILALSDPPYYTACPNPFLPEIIEQWQAERAEIRAELGLPDDNDGDYHQEPFASDVSEGKRGSIYSAHLPHQGAPQSRHALHPALHRAGRCGLRRFLWNGMTGVGSAALRRPQSGAGIGLSVAEDNGLMMDDDG